MKLLKIYSVLLVKINNDEQVESLVIINNFKLILDCDF